MLTVNCKKKEVQKKSGTKNSVSVVLKIKVAPAQLKYFSACIQCKLVKLQFTVKPFMFL